MGCSTKGYWGDRERDALDTFTFTLGYGLGAKARIGPLETGLLFAVEGPGVRGGDFIWGMEDYWHPGTDLPQGIDAKLLVVGVESFEGGKTAMARGKSFGSNNIAFLSWSVNLLETDPQSRFIERLNEAEYVFNPWPFYTQIDAAAALGPAVRLGTNPGELIDFVLGWTTLDLYSDDLSKRTRGDRKDELFDIHEQSLKSADSPAAP